MSSSGMSQRHAATALQFLIMTFMMSNLIGRCYAENNRLAEISELFTWAWIGGMGRGMWVHCREGEGMHVGGSLACS